jgi:hypothetical protein
MMPVVQSVVLGFSTQTCPKNRKTPVPPVGTLIIETTVLLVFRIPDAEMPSAEITQSS